MGTWGAALLSDDFALDVKDEYQALLAFGVAEDEAYQLVKKEFYDSDESIEDTSDASVFWLVIASIQRRYGILMPKVKERALYYIESGKDIENWEEGGAEPQDIKKRRAVLSKLKGELMSEPLPRRKVPKPSSYQKPRWEVGDIVSGHLIWYYFRDQGDYYYNRYVLYRVIALEKTPLSHLKPDLASSVWPKAILFDWMGDAVPDASVIDSLGYHAWADTHRYILYRKEIYTDPFNLSWIPSQQKLELVRHDPDFILPKDIALPPPWPEWLEDRSAGRKPRFMVPPGNELAILYRDQAHFEAIYEKYKQEGGTPS